MKAQVVERAALAEHALDLASKGWAVFPLAGKVPWIAKRDGGNGVLDATTDPAIVACWWRRFPTANIGARVPDARIVVDVDPRHDGHLRLAEHEAAHRPLPPTLTTWSGRRGWWAALYFRRPTGKLTAARLGDGVDLKTNAGYCVVPPSLHPATGRPYRWALHEVGPGRCSRRARAAGGLGRGDRGRLGGAGRRRSH